MLDAVKMMMVMMTVVFLIHQNYDNDFDLCYNYDMFDDNDY